jgi:23S rRNA (adenine2503-C2)-methyltransferase
MARSILDLSQQELTAWLAERGQAGYRAGQIRQWLFQGRASSFEQMSNLPKTLRTQLAEAFTIFTATVAKHNQADDGTEKLLLELADRGRIECVLLRDGDRRSICISTQVGCAMGCVFCASGLDGVDRNLTTAEIIEQMLRLQHLLPADERLSHIVIMGMGEPLANLDGLLPALEFASSDEGLGISARRITISTVGLPKAIDRLCTENTRYNLAVSLHAPNDELRTQIVPVNKAIGMAAVLAAADRYFDVSGRKLTFEYVLLAELNDHLEHARQLADLLAGRTALLNVIPYNPVAGLPYRTPSREAISQFREILEARGINVQFRERKGDRINAACGQLRRSFAVARAVTDALALPVLKE